MDFSWKSVILHVIYACVSAAMPVACTVDSIVQNHIGHLIMFTQNILNIGVSALTIVIRVKHCLQAFAVRNTCMGSGVVVQAMGFGAGCF